MTNHEKLIANNLKETINDLTQTVLEKATDISAPPCTFFLKDGRPTGMFDTSILLRMISKNVKKDMDKGKVEFDNQFEMADCIMHLFQKTIGSFYRWVCKEEGINGIIQTGEVNQIQGETSSKEVALEHTRKIGKVSMQSKEVRAKVIEELGLEELTCWSLVYEQKVGDKIAFGISNYPFEDNNGAKSWIGAKFVDTPVDDALEGKIPIGAIATAVHTLDVIKDVYFSKVKENDDNDFSWSALHNMIKAEG